MNALWTLPMFRRPIQQTLCAAAACAVCSVASAQSVQVSGVVDLMFKRDTAGSRTVNTLTEGGNQASRVTFSGSEDLGGGLRANF